MNTENLSIDFKGSIVKIGKHSISNNWENLLLQIQYNKKKYWMEINQYKNGKWNLIESILFGEYKIGDLLNIRALIKQSENKSTKLVIISLN